MHFPRRAFPAAAGLAILAAPDPAAAIALGQTDDFENGTTQGWSEGAVSPNPPTNVASGGPLGAGDNYLQNVSTGGAGAGSKLVFINDSQWTGNYPAAGVIGIRVWLKNAGAVPLTMRVAFEGAGTRYSTAGYSLPADGQWHQAMFALDNLTLIAGTASAAQTMAAVVAVRILAAATPNWLGDTVATTVGVDGITAVDEVVPVRPATWGSLKARHGTARP